MRLTELTLAALLCAALVVGVGCGGGGPSISKPQINYVPEGWSIAEEHPYPNGHCWGGIWGDVECGELAYMDIPSRTDLLVHYGDIPASLQSNVSDRNKLINEAQQTIYSLLGENVTEIDTGIMDIGTCRAGYSKVYFPSKNSSHISIIFVKGDTFVSIFTVWGRYSQAVEQETMTLIESITF
jgi:hypothetical protein